MKFSKYLNKVPENWIPKYNISPGMAIPVILRKNNLTILDLLQWGFVPKWTKNLTTSYKIINARSETLFDKPSFRDSIRDKKCLIPANGFYEWDKSKQPYYVKPVDNDNFYFAGIHESWINREDNKTINSTAIITTAANTKISGIHDRMPVIIPEKRIEEWLTEKNPERIRSFFVSLDDSNVSLYPVEKRVNSPKNNDSSLISKLI